MCLAGERSTTKTMEAGISNPKEDDTPSVSFLGLYRCVDVHESGMTPLILFLNSWATKFELVMNFIGLMCAAAAGAGQV